MRIPPHAGRERPGLGLRALAVCLFLIGPANSGKALAQDFGAPASALYGEDAASLQPFVDRIVGEAVAREAIPGAIVGVSWRGRRAFFGYSGTGGAPYGPETIVEIGSITKVFTTALFAEAVQEGAMQRDASIQDYLPRLRLHACAAAVTPLQLADFTSGMPELPGDVPRRLAERGIDTYTSEDFLAWVGRWAPGDGGRCNLPAPYRYSNASVGLLGYLVAERLGARWEELVRARITGPLRMSSTTVRVPPDQAGRIAQGFGPEGGQVIPWPVFAWYAAGALRSTASDMLAFGEAALGHERVNGERVPPALTTALATAMAPIYQPEGQPFVQGMAWIENPGDPEAGTHPVTLKIGGTDGFNSILVINPGKDLAVFIAGSRPKMQIERLGVSLSRQIR
ncbi:serine hydrolase domain-containing protein [Methylobacterium sp. E-045]|uniref:serine hydrolase domain-containing protein n=1 Tax=Methylobacterium sp. E-045 TaxID=2836575 RepID=UPI001FBADF5A|nr:serine hydrolase [Methylobacterium sp. E-045]MCJ2130971.1 serine hydrolase [Methylobacterium sp. E-045]